MELSEIMAAFAADIGLDGLEPDADGVFHLSVDDMSIKFAEIKGTRQLVTFAEVGEPPPGCRDNLYRVLMEAMFMGRATNGAMFSVPEGGETICLQRLDGLESLKLDDFKATLEAFVNDLERWKKFVAEFQDIATEIAADREREAAEVREIGLGARILG